jgi:hypothetical protein
VRACWLCRVDLSMTRTKYEYAQVVIGLMLVSVGLVYSKAGGVAVEPCVQLMVSGVILVGGLA